MWLGSLLLSQTISKSMTDRTSIRYAKLTETVKLSLLKIQSQHWPFSILTFALHPQSGVLPASGRRLLLNPKGLDRGRLSTWPWTSHYVALFPEPPLWVWGQTTLAAPLLISLTGLSLDPVAHCLMEPVSAPRGKFNQAPPLNILK